MIDNNNKKVGIAGVGGIGSNVASILVRNGVTDLKVVDFDVVEAVNLNRQLYFHDQVGNYKVDMLKENLLRIKPELDIESEVLRLDRSNITETFADCSIIVEGFDDKKSKIEFIEAFAGTEKLTVGASGIAGLSLEEVKIRRIGNCYIVGDHKSDIENETLFPAKVFMVASIMSHIVLEKGGLYLMS